MLHCVNAERRGGGWLFSPTRAYRRRGAIEGMFGRMQGDGRSGRKQSVWGHPYGNYRNRLAMSNKV